MDAMRSSKVTKPESVVPSVEILNEGISKCVSLVVISMTRRTEIRELTNCEDCKEAFRGLCERVD